MDETANVRKEGRRSLGTLRRRYLTQNELLDVAAGDWTPPRVQAEVERGVIRRGLIHKCPVCRWASWFDQEEVGDKLRCARCRERVSIADPDWFGSSEPRWHYRLAEVVWQLLDANGDLPVRGLHQHLWDPALTMDATPELDLWAPGANKPIEIDICVQRGFELWIGEAKVGGNLGTGADEREKIDKLRQAADALDAHGVLLVTAAAEFRKASHGRISAAFPDGKRPRVKTVSVPPIGLA